MKILLIFTLCSPLVELFPNLYMSWWAPSNGNLKKYAKKWPRRIAVVGIVWLPLLFLLSNIIQSLILIIFITCLVVTAFGLRVYLFKKEIEHETDLDTHTSQRWSSVPELLYFIAFILIGYGLYIQTPDYKSLIIVGIGHIFIGARLMTVHRRGLRQHLTLDVVGRVIFTFGFILNIFNIYRVLPG